MDGGIFDPLDYRNVAVSVVGAMLARPLSRLPPRESFSGGGVYVSYFKGKFPAYKRISGTDVPIYVGKAVPPGGRIGAEVPIGDDPDSLPMIEPNPGTVLYKRLCEHAESVSAAENLRDAKSSCRYLAVTHVWIVFAEEILIRRFRPFWNLFVKGFGNHDVGKGRHNQRRSDWDEVHPGRKWATKCKPALRRPNEIIASIKANDAQEAVVRSNRHCGK